MTYSDSHAVAVTQSQIPQQGGHTSCTQDGHTCSTQGSHTGSHTGSTHDSPFHLPPPHTSTRSQKSHYSPPPLLPLLGRMTVQRDAQGGPRLRAHHLRLAHLQLWHWCVQHESGVYNMVHLQLSLPGPWPRFRLINSRHCWAGAVRYRHLARHQPVLRHQVPGRRRPQRVEDAVRYMQEASTASASSLSSSKRVYGS